MKRKQNMELAVIYKNRMESKHKIHKMNPLLVIVRVILTLMAELRDTQHYAATVNDGHSYTGAICNRLNKIAEQIALFKSLWIPIYPTLREMMRYLKDLDHGDISAPNLPVIQKETQDDWHLTYTNIKDHPYYEASKKRAKKEREKTRNEKRYAKTNAKCTFNPLTLNYYFDIQGMYDSPVYLALTYTKRIRLKDFEKKEDKRFTVAQDVIRTLKRVGIMPANALILYNENVYDLYDQFMHSIDMEDEIEHTSNLLKINFIAKQLGLFGNLRLVLFVSEYEDEYDLVRNATDDSIIVNAKHWKEIRKAKRRKGHQDTDDFHWCFKEDYLAKMDGSDYSCKQSSKVRTGSRSEELYRRKAFEEMSLEEILYSWAKDFNLASDRYNMYESDSISFGGYRQLWSKKRCEEHGVDLTRQMSPYMSTTWDVKQDDVDMDVALVYEKLDFMRRYKKAHPKDEKGLWELWMLLCEEDTITCPHCGLTMAEPHSTDKHDWICPHCNGEVVPRVFEESYGVYDIADNDRAVEDILHGEMDETYNEYIHACETTDEMDFTEEDSEEEIK